MTIFRTILGVLALTAALVGTVCGVLGLGTHTVAYPWLVGLVALLGWDAIWYAQHRRAKDPVTLVPNKTARTPLQLRIDLHDAARHYQDELRATWPHEMGIE